MEHRTVPRLFLLLVLGLFIPVSARADGESPPSATEIHRQFVPSQTEWEKIRKGEIVVRSFPLRSDDLGGTAFILAPQPAWRLWQTITDFPEYPHFFPRNTFTKVLERRADSILLKTVLSTSASSEPVWSESEIRFDQKDPALLLMAWKGIRTSLKRNEGFWLLQGQEKDHTLITYQTKFELKRIPSTIARPYTKRTLIKNLQAIVERAKNERYNAKPGQIAFRWE